MMRLRTGEVRREVEPQNTDPEGVLGRNCRTGTVSNHVGEMVKGGKAVPSHRQSSMMSAVGPSAILSHTSTAPTTYT